jgi:PAS domain S-box-containing protein
MGGEMAEKFPDHRDTLNSDELQQYRDLFRFAPIGIVRTTADGEILLGNKAFAEMLGYENFEEFATLAGTKVLDLYEDPQRRELLLDHQRQSVAPLHFESRWRKKDGGYCYCRLHVRAFVDNRGIFRFFEGFIEDISRQKKIEEALKESAERYRSVFENTGTATIIIENDTTVSLANERFADLTGYSKEEIEGKIKWPVLIANNTDLTRMLQYHVSRRLSVDDIPIEYEFTLRDKNGNLKDVFLRVDMIADSAASVASLLDITSLKNIRRSLRESESRLSGILEAFDGHIYICSEDYRLLFMNRKLKESLVSTAEDQPCHKRLYGLDLPCGWCDCPKVFAGTTVKLEFQHPNDGRWYYSVSSPVYEEENRISRKQTVIIDIHERRMSEEALREREMYLAKENLRLRENIRDRYKFGSIIGKSKVMQKVYELILRAAGTSANVIIYGESGTGKELVAKAIHEMSDRAAQPFIPVNCGAIPAGLMESEYFGYSKGAFTGADKDKPGLFERADGGTLFLDELGEIDESMQVKLLRVLEGHGYTPLGGLQSGKSDVRIISATNRNLRALLDNGRMREDFFYRIHIIPISLPPVRERREDIPLLVEHFLKKYAAGKVHFPHGRDLDRLIKHDWPGNVRELENTIQRYVNLNVLEFSGEEGDARKYSRLLPKGVSESATLPLREATKQFERALILEQLQVCRWNRTLVARRLGIQRKTLYLKMQQLQIQDGAGE